MKKIRKKISTVSALVSKLKAKKKGTSKLKEIKFEHTLVTADELFKRNVKNVAVAMVTKDNNVPDIKYIKGQGYGQEVWHNAQLMPEMFIIQRIDRGYTNDPSVGTIHYLYYTGADGRELLLYVSPETQFAELTGTKAKEIQEEHKKLVWKQLSNNLGHSFTIGSDPEIFVVNKKGEVIPAFTFLSSNKDPKHNTKDGLPVYWDGFQAEFQALAASCLGTMSRSVQGGLEAVYNAALKVNKDAQLSVKSLMGIGKDVLFNAAEEHVALGCAPSFNVYGMKGEPVEDGRLLTIRPAGGHMHFGITGTYGKQSHETVKDMVKALDAILGVCCVALFAKYDDPLRRKYYGLAGEYRLPPHGLEYRTLSNAWLIHPLLMNFVYDFGRKVLVFGHKGYMENWKGSEEETIRCINTCDVKLAHEIMERNKETILKIMGAAYKRGESDSLTEAMYNIFYNGLDCIIKNPNDIPGNWNFGKDLYAQTEKEITNARSFYQGVSNKQIEVAGKKKVA